MDNENARYETLTEVIERKGLTMTNTGKNPAKTRVCMDDWQRKSKGYRLQFHYQGRKLTFDFWQGTGIKTPPGAVDCMACLLSDAIAGDQDFLEFCGEYGCDNDSIKARDIWQACRKNGVKLRKLLKDDFDAFAFAERE